MDLFGVMLLLGTVCSLFLVLQQGGNAWPWRSANIIGLLSGFTVQAALFGVVQFKHGGRTTIPLRLLQDRTVITGSVRNAAVVSLSMQAESAYSDGKSRAWPN